ncbi:MAG: histidine kinase dimerization/phospho-acceptor domain-containing protein [Pseudobdellovibrio sp.]
MERPKLLYIDDEIDNLDALERLLRRKFEFFKASVPQDAFNHLDQHPDIAIIISDQRMPLITGVEFLEKSIDTHPDSIRILLTGYTDIESVIEAVNKGQIYKYITKPWDPVDLLKSLENAYEKFSLRKELKSKNQALEKALFDLQSLDKTKSQFMILINHELKTPLTSILSFAGLLKETSLTDEQNLFTDRILKSSEKLKNIIDDVLLIVKGELGQINLNISTINLETCLNYINEDIQLMIGAKSQALSLHLNATTVNSDPILFRIILNRALHNATKFGLPGSDLKINSYKIGQRTILEIQNKGPHISKAILDKILKPFTLDENVMNHSVGMGLGLTICQTILKAHQGFLEIENSENGVTVRFIFP